MNVYQVNPEDEIIVKTGPKTFAKFKAQELLDTLKPAKGNKSKRSKNPEGLLCRQVGLLTNAIIKGKWSTGAEVSREECLGKLMILLTNNPLSHGIYVRVTPLLDGKYLTPSEAGAIKEIFANASYEQTA